MATAAVFPPLISISQLHPGLEAAAISVTGIVTLVWPYASSTHSSSLLLVESDFRLRRHRGQVRIYFDGASAKAVAKLGVSSGDHITISLKGASWGKDASAASTPGKGIEWDLRYRNRVFLQVRDRRRDRAPLNGLRSDVVLRSLPISILMIRFLHQSKQHRNLPHDVLRTIVTFQ